MGQLRSWYSGNCGPGCGGEILVVKHHQIAGAAEVDHGRGRGHGRDSVAVLEDARGADAVAHREGTDGGEARGEGRGDESARDGHQ